MLCRGLKASEQRTLAPGQKQKKRTVAKRWFVWQPSYFSKEKAFENVLERTGFSHQSFTPKCLFRSQGTGSIFLQKACKKISTFKPLPSKIFRAVWGTTPDIRKNGDSSIGVFLSSIARKTGRSRPYMLPVQNRKSHSKDPPSTKKMEAISYNLFIYKLHHR